MVVPGCVHIETPVSQVVDIRIFGHELQLVDDAVVWHGAIPSFSGRVLSRRTVPGPLFQNKRDFLNHRARLTCAWHGSE